MTKGRGSGKVALRRQSGGKPNMDPLLSQNAP
jgi:hypothetical protein